MPGTIKAMSNKSKPLIVQFGAGAIGRGFLAQLWTKSGGTVLFVDVNETLVNLLHARGSYPIRITGDAAPRRWVPHVDACLARDEKRVAESLSVCEFACTAVGVAQFANLAPLIAQGITRRGREYHQDGWADHPLNLICCENQKNAAQILRDETEKHLPNAENVRAYFEKHVGFVDASVGRMVPPPPAALLAEDPLFMLAEPYAELPIDGAAWKGDVPPIDGLLPKNNFAGYVARKLFTHNGGHALLAYEGFLRGHTFIWQCVEDTEIAAHLRGFWDETGAALCAAYGFDAAEQKAHENDLRARFANKELGDTVLRVARDPVRKLREGDRLTGAARLCEAHGIEPVFAARALAAALQFAPPKNANDPSAQTVQRTVCGPNGVQRAMTLFAGIEPSENLGRLVERFYHG